MIKFAYIVNVNADTEKYNCLCDKGNFPNYLFGVNGTECGVRYAKQLIDNDFDCFNLCGDFTDEDAAEIEREGIKVKRARYSESDEAKLESLKGSLKFGFLIVDPGLAETVSEDREDEDLSIYVRFSKDIDDACIAAKELADKGVCLIELCSWFNDERTDAVTEATGRSIPIGSCRI